MSWPEPPTTVTVAYVLVRCGPYQECEMSHEAKRVLHSARSLTVTSVANAGDFPRVVGVVLSVHPIRRYARGPGGAGAKG
jgi:hypothetical protein